jgi:hypothetical protein
MTIAVVITAVMIDGLPSALVPSGVRPRAARIF